MESNFFYLSLIIVVFLLVGVIASKKIRQMVGSAYEIIIFKSIPALFFIIFWCTIITLLIALTYKWGRGLYDTSQAFRNILNGAIPIGIWFFITVIYGLLEEKVERKRILSAGKTRLALQWNQNKDIWGQRIVSSLVIALVLLAIYSAVALKPFSNVRWSTIFFTIYLLCLFAGYVIMRIIEKIRNSR